jgi:hypothetical protein
MARPRKKPLILPDNWRDLRALPLPLWAKAHGVSEMVARRAVEEGNVRSQRLGKRGLVIFMDEPPKDPPEPIPHPTAKHVAGAQRRVSGRFGGFAFNEDKPLAPRPRPPRPVPS